MDQVIALPSVTKSHAACVAVGIGLAASVAAAAPEMLRIGVTELPPSRGHPYAAMYLPTIYTQSAMYDGLTHITGAGNVIPWLASSWRATSPTTWEFTLRDGVRFSNGESFDAAAVASAVEVLTQPASSAWALARELATLKSARVIAPNVVEITTDAPNPMLPREVAWLLLPAPEAWRRVDADTFAARPVGTGPYQLTEWNAGRAQFDRFEGSWRRPAVPHLEFRQIPDNAARVQALVSDQIDAIITVNPDDRAIVESAGGRLVTVNVAGVSALAFNTEKDSPLRDVRIRRAINHAVNRQRIIDVFLLGATAPASQPAARHAEGYNDALPLFDFDPARAKALLAEAGYPAGFAFVVESGSGSGSLNSMVIEQVAGDLNAIGITMEIRASPNSQVLQKIQNGGWEGTAFYMLFYTPTMDAMRTMRNQSCLGATPWYCDPSAMPLINEALNEFDVDRRRDLARRVMAQAHEAAQALFLFDGVTFSALGARVRELPGDFGFYRYEAVKWSGP
jgi:peptide/nickel transport system substrate-binding protein